jgi:hypothetical protein
MLLHLHPNCGKIRRSSWVDTSPSRTVPRLAIFFLVERSNLRLRPFLRCATCSTECLNEAYYCDTFSHGDLPNRDCADDIGDRVYRVMYRFELFKFEFDGLLATRRESVLKAEPDRIDVTLQRLLGGFLRDCLQLSIQEDLGSECRTIFGAEGATGWVAGLPLCKRSASR